MISPPWRRSQVQHFKIASTEHVYHLPRVKFEIASAEAIFRAPRFWILFSRNNESDWSIFTATFESENFCHLVPEVSRDGITDRGFHVNSEILDWMKASIHIRWRHFDKIKNKSLVLARFFTIIAWSYLLYKRGVGMVFTNPNLNYCKDQDESSHSPIPNSFFSPKSL